MELFPLLLISELLCALRHLTYSFPPSCPKRCLLTNLWPKPIMDPHLPASDDLLVENAKFVSYTIAISSEAQRGHRVQKAS